MFGGEPTTPIPPLLREPIVLPTFALMVTGDVGPRVFPDEARDTVAAVAARIPQHATLWFKCGHSRPALSGPSRKLNEVCRDCLSGRGTFKNPDAIPFINFRPFVKAFREGMLG